MSDNFRAIASKYSKIVTVQFLFGLLLAICNKAVARDCDYELPEVSTYLDPVYFNLIWGANNKLELVKPINGTIFVRDGHHVIVACPGERNRFATENSQYQIATCRINFPEAFRSKLDQYSKCIEEKFAEVLLTNNNCYNGFINEVGYKVGNFSFVAQYHVCVDRKTFIPHYSRYIINGLGIRKKQWLPRKRGYGPDFVPNTFYNNNTRNIEIFEHHLGKQQSYISKDDKTSFINPISFGHFAALKDFVLGYEQKATNFRINGAPQFQNMNNGNWAALEQMIRRLAQEEVKGDLEVFTGQIGLLYLRHSDRSINSYKAICFDDTCCATYMPEAYFKAIRNEKTNEGIVFITMQDILADDYAKNKFVVSSCATVNLDDCPTGWRKSRYIKISRGFTICCKLNNFVSRYRILPQSIVNATTRLMDIPEDLYSYE